MGIHNRDYIRDDDRSFLGGSGGGYGGGFDGSSGGPWAVWQIIIAITAGAYVAQILIPPFTSWFELSPIWVFQYGQLWRLLSYAFLHDIYSIWHILWNMVLLYFFGRRLESMYGAKEFGWFYCVSAMFAGLCFLAWGVYYRELNPVIGASGSILAIVVLFALHYPYERIGLFFGLITVEMRWIAGVLVILDLHPLLLQVGGNETFSDRIAHTAHAGGALFAFLYFKQRWRITRWTSRLEALFESRPTLQRKPTLKVYREEPGPDLEGEVDRLLQKIQDHGEASLTDKERKTLQQASERYKKRQT